MAQSVTDPGGMTVSPDSAAESEQHDGTTYYGGVRSAV